jgi:predicted porin
MMHTFSHVAAGTAIVATLAWPVAASAQVTLYGRLETSLNLVDVASAGTVKTLSSDVSFFGLRGREDLGGGLSVQFKLESQLRADTGAQGNPAQFWNREAYVGLGSTRYGTLLLGSQWAPLMNITIPTSPFARTQAGAAPTVLQGAVNRGYTLQNQNAVSWFSPDWAGTTLQLQTAAGEGALARNHGAALSHARDRLYLALAWDDAQTAGATVGLPAVASTRSRTWALGGSYRFDPVKLFGYAQHNSVSGLPNVNGWLAGLSIPAGFGEYRFSYSATDRPGAKASQLAAGYTHMLSKRTQVYLNAAHIDNEGTARFVPWPAALDLAGNPIVQSGRDMRVLQAGIRHDF